MKEVDRSRLKRITHEEAVKVKNEVSNILLTYAVLNIAVSDIKFEFDEVGRYRQRLKAQINNIEKSVVALFNSVRYRLIKGDSRNVVYDKWNSKVCEAVGEAILLEAPERSVNIAPTIVSAMQSSVAFTVLPKEHASYTNLIAP